MPALAHGLHHARHSPKGDVGSPHQIPPNLQITTATPDDRDELGHFLLNAFLTNGGQPFHFLERLPHLFTENRMHEHAIAKQNGKIIGCVGGYRFPFQSKGITFQTCGIGQVATAPSARDQGVMQALMNATLERNADCDFFWLYGIRPRYAHFGFELGGSYTEYFFEKRDLLKLAPKEPPKISVSTEYDTILLDLRSSGSYLQLDAHEAQYCFQGKALEIISTDQAEILYSRNDQYIHYVWGEKSHLAALFLHVIDTYRNDDAVYHHFSENDGSLPHALLPHFADANQQTSANFRIGNLETLLPKATAHQGLQAPADTDQQLALLAPLTPLQQSATLFSPYPSQIPREIDPSQLPSLSDLHIPRIYAL